MALIPTTIPAAIGGGGVAFTATTVAYDVAIAGVPFCSAVSADSPYIRESSPTQKQQFDSGPRAGERSLGDWWRRSQASFHAGAGLKYAEPDGPEDPIANIRYLASKNLDVWTPGQVTRLPDTTQAVTVGSAMTGLVTATSGGVNFVLVTFGSTLRSWTGAGFTDYNWLGTGTILSLATDGQRYYVADNTGIYSGPVDGSVIATKLWNNAGNTRVKLSWVKQRLMCAQNNVLYELIGVGPALPAAKYTHPNSGWTWTDFTDGPSAILVSGYSGIESAIFELTLATDGSTPVLVAGQSHPLPTGEVCYSLFAYVGSFLGMGTSRGIRIGQYNIYGTFSYGPLICETASPVKSITGRDRFLYATATGFVDAETCLIRVDLGQPIDQAGRFAYASDLLCPSAQTGVGSWVAVTATNKLVFTVDGYGVVLEGTGPGSVRDAWLDTARIRMATIEPKLFRGLLVRGAFPAPGTVSVVVTASDTEVITAIPPVSSSNDLDELSVIPAAQEWVTLRFLLNGASTIDFRGYVLKAIPATPPRRLYQLPLKVSDNETDRFGVKFGYPGFGVARLLQLEALEDARDEVRLEIFTELGVYARQCIIEQVSYKQVHEPGQTGFLSGIVMVTLKTVQ
jgi:hypothetical protein